MGEVIEIKPDSIFYVKNFQNEIYGVGDADSGIRFELVRGSYVCVEGPEASELIKSDNFKQLCIAWLALNYPDVLKFDDEGT